MRLSTTLGLALLLGCAFILEPALGRSLHVINLFEESDEDFCATQSPESFYPCCLTRPADPACPPLLPISDLGSHCVSLGTKSWWDCCMDKVEGDILDTSCPPPQCGVLPLEEDAAACCASKGFPHTDPSCPPPPIPKPRTVGGLPAPSTLPTEPEPIIEIICFNLNKTLPGLEAIIKNLTEALGQAEDPAEKEMIGVLGQQQIIDFITTDPMALMTIED